MSLFDKCRDFTAYRDSIEAGIYPYFHELQSGQAPEVVMEGKRRIMLKNTEAAAAGRGF